MEELKIKSKVRDFKIRFTNNFNFINVFLSYPYYVVIVGSVVYKIYKKKIFDKFPRKNLIVLKLDEKDLLPRTAGTVETDEGEVIITQKSADEEVQPEEAVESFDEEEDAAEEASA